MTTRQIEMIKYKNSRLLKWDTMIDNCIDELRNAADFSMKLILEKHLDKFRHEKDAFEKRCDTYIQNM